MGIQYEHAPIIEALIDIGLDPLPGSSLPALKQMGELIEERLPDVEDYFRLSAEGQLKADAGYTERLNSGGTRPFEDEPVNWGGRHHGENGSRPPPVAITRVGV